MVDIKDIKKQKKRSKEEGKEFMKDMSETMKQAELKRMIPDPKNIINTPTRR